MINTCVECGEKFEHRRLAKVCKSCQEKPVECPICKTEFVRKATNQTCCSSECTKQYKKIRPKTPKPVIDMDEVNEIIGDERMLDKTVKEFDVKPKMGECSIEKCDNCGGTKFIFNCGGNDKKGWMEYRCTARGCAYSHFFKWGYEQESEEIISE